MNESTGVAFFPIRQSMSPRHCASRHTISPFKICCHSEFFSYTVRMKQNPIARRVYASLWDAFARRNPHIVHNRIGYVPQVRDNLLPLVEPRDFHADLTAGDGKELQGSGRSPLPKFLAIHSSAALVVNCFAPFRRRIADLASPASKPFRKLQFERKCPAGLHRARPPHVDVLAEGPVAVIGIESKLTEYLQEKSARFSPAYEKQIRDERREQGYFKEMLRLMRKPDAYKCLDAAQLIKCAFGLANTFRNQPVTLLYLYWEPANPDAIAVFAQHREEISEFAERMAGSTPEFKATSYPDLWQHWRRTKPDVEWLIGHIEQLTARYLVKV